MIELSPAAHNVVLAFADDEHIIGSRHANWIGLGPFLEEDLAFCSIAQDELGHALALYDLIVPAAEIDRFALLRDPSDYRSCELAELECGTWDLALVRHWLYDTAEQFRWTNLLESSITELAELAAQALRDEAFHVSHAEMFMSRMHSDAAARAKVEAALQTLLPSAGSVWHPTEGEADAVAEGVIAGSSPTLAQQWVEQIQTDLDRFGLSGLPTLEASGDRTTRSAGFGPFHTSLGEVISLDTAAIW